MSRRFILKKKPVQPPAPRPAEQKRKGPPARHKNAELIAAERRRREVFSTVLKQIQEHPEVFVLYNDNGQLSVGIHYNRMAKSLGIHQRHVYKALELARIEKRIQTRRLSDHECMVRFPGDIPTLVDPALFATVMDAWKQPVPA